MRCRLGTLAIGLFVALASVPAAAQHAESKSQKPAKPMSAKQKIDTALRAAPADIAANAAVVEVGPDGTMKELRPGTNGWVCMAEPEIMCLDKPWQDWAAAWIGKKDPQTNAIGVAYMLAGEKIGASNTDPYATEPSADNDWIISPAHIMILVPDTADLEGLPTHPHAGGPWVMWKGTKYAHIMVPTEPMPPAKKTQTQKK